jgi:hypothetical protein
VDSLAATAAEIVIETLAADVSERGATRMDDKTSDARWKSARKTGTSDEPAHRPATPERSQADDTRPALRFITCGRWTTARAR